MNADPERDIFAVTYMVGRAVALCSKGLEESGIARGKAPVDPDILTGEPPEMPKVPSQVRHPNFSNIWPVFGPRQQYANPAHPV
jgi:hypothetical protein